MSLEGELRRLDFTDNEIKVYLALLRMGRGMAGEISCECGLERSSTYNAIKRLIEKGIVSSVIESNRHVFTAAGPAKILDIFQEKKERAALVIPQLEKLRSAEREKESMLKFRGFAGVKTILNDVLRSCEGKEYLAMGSEGKLFEKMPTFAKIFAAKKDKNRVRTRILTNEKLDYLSKNCKVKYLPCTLSTNLIIKIYGGKVALIIWSSIPEAIMIDNADTAETFRSYFEFMWLHAKMRKEQA